MSGLSRIPVVLRQTPGGPSVAKTGPNETSSVGRKRSKVEPRVRLLSCPAGKIEFYRRHGFEMVLRDQVPVLLRRYLSVPERQIETSVVLAEKAWRDRS